MKYIKVGWPEIQDFMDRKDFSEDSYYDPRKNVWFVPYVWDKEPDIDYLAEPGTKEYFDQNDCYDAIGGDWEG